MNIQTPLQIDCKAGDALQTALKHRDEYTQYHCERVAQIAIKTGKKLNLSEHELNNLEVAAVFHDIGKIGIPDDILLHPGKLNEQQYELMKQHVYIGANIVEKLDIPNADEIAKIIFHHHENYDGSGYPDGLLGDEIPLLSRIICIIDVFDALTGERRYRNAASVENTLQMMSLKMGDKFDPKLLSLISPIILNDITLS